ncbi:substrate-binding domain-containing protein [Galbitalea soli]|uniref:LacI family transcriptional regulator n=1 Tax=Galbitalea soli TaxID=1268042 RepID=A0A7C9PMF6_9MICO|nr:LacI family transcriptional regulator [Galbitalea soli]NYJ29619.1 DNA-binding LacI/PurR family transcriptional regulator [Galbitalea soli]
MTGIHEVATRAGVSTATVSRVLSGRGTVAPATRERVQLAVAELGYVVSSNASSLATGRTRNVGVVVPFLDRWYFTSVVEGAQAALQRHGFDLTLYNLRGGGRAGVFDHFLHRKRVDAVVAIALELSTGEIQRLLDMNKPIVGVGGPLPGVRTLSIDDIEVGRLATEHLLSLGHRAIGHIGGDPESETDFHVPSYRRTGYQLALEAAGVPIDPALDLNADFTIQGGYAAARRLLSTPVRPSAIFAASDEMAIGAILAARDLGLRLPDELAVIGVDDHPLAAFFGLSTVAQHPAEQGAQAVEILIEELLRTGDEPSAFDTPIEFRLIVRESTARLPSL